METLIMLKDSFQLEIMQILSKVNVKLSNGYLSITALTNEVDKLSTLRTNLLELNEQNIAISLHFTVNKVRIKDMLTNKYQLQDKDYTIDCILSADNFQINKVCKYTDNSGIDRQFTLNNFNISIFTEFTACEDITLEYIELN